MDRYLFLRELRFFKNTISRVIRGLAPTKHGVLRSAVCDKRESSIVILKYRN